MAVFKCKMCGGALTLEEHSTTITCDYCGSQQTLPNLSDDKVERLYDRANHFRRNNEFDKAMGIYEQILDENPEDAESYWSIVLCRYGIEYVVDPASRKRIPTVNRTQFTSVFDDDNYKSALKYADASQKMIYEREAHAINEIQKKILDISQKEEPFDVFICYKETDDRGQRTHDSVYANDLYHELKQEGYKVFFARITLEDKLGVAYEPYIFAALNSAKVMIVIGSKPEYFNAVWVKNEWSRYLALIKSGQKKFLIPAYRDMDPYDLPTEFSHLQAQDMSKLGFMPDLVRGIKKLIGNKSQRPAQQASASSQQMNATVAGGGAYQVGNTNTVALLRRISMFLEEQEWDTANTYCERVLDLEPENGKAYVYKLMAQLRCSTEEELASHGMPLDGFPSYRNALRFSDDETAKRLMTFNRQIKDRIEARKREQARIEAERLAAERRELERIRREKERKQQEMQTMIETKNSAQEFIAAKVREKDQLTTIIAVKKFDPTLPGRVRTSAIFTVIFNFLIILWSFGVPDYGYIDWEFLFGISDYAEMWVVIAGVIGIFQLIFSIKLYKALGKSAAWFLIDGLTFHVYSTVIAIMGLIEYRHEKTVRRAQELNALYDQFNDVQEKIENAKQAVRDLNQKIEELAD
ncbi:MAG: toll/interleukin-1 receptor domain-containing protein [Clostridia bacterium]|nr:toll/interleukin-1 receptor domain-containing protein [Clostridia bacterium]